MELKAIEIRYNDKIYRVNVGKFEDWKLDIGNVIIRSYEMNYFYIKYYNISDLKAFEIDFICTNDSEEEERISCNTFIFMMTSENKSKTIIDKDTFSNYEIRWSKNKLSDNSIGDIPNSFNMLSVVAWR